MDLENHLLTTITIKMDLDKNHRYMLKGVGCRAGGGAGDFQSQSTSPQITYRTTIQWSKQETPLRA